METLYWLGEYGKVFCGYMFFMFLWPSVVFSKHLRYKGKIYRFSFCVLIQVLIANSVVLGLGVFHILNRWVVFSIFYGIFFANVVNRINFQYRQGAFSDVLSSGYRVLMGTSGLKVFLYNRVEKLVVWLKRVFLKFWRIIRPNLMEYTVLLMICIYGMIYFSYGVFQDYNYGFGDMYVHHEWIDELLKGNIFCKGVYPEAMHCFIYCLHVLFGLKVYNCMLFLAGIHVSVLLVSAYIFFREAFEWKYTPFFVLIMFLMLDLMCIQEVYGMSRLQWTLPQEFGLCTPFLCALFLLRYLKSPRRYRLKKRVERYIWNEDLFLFMLSLAVSVAIHFYCTIMAFLLCISFAVFFLRRILKKERLIPLAAAVLCAVLIAVTPMVAALASGIPFEGSIGWALGVMNNEEIEDGVVENIQEKEIVQEEGTTFREKIKNTISILYWGGYVTLYREDRARWLIGFTGFAVILWTACYILRRVYRLITKRRLRKNRFSGYMPVIAASVLFMIVYASPGFGLPQLIADSRICTTEQMLLLAVMAIPVDVLFFTVSRFCMDCILQVLSVFTAAGLCSFIVMSGNYHGYLYCELSRYNAAIKVTDSIINNFPKYSYTIVSTTDELYHVSNDGRHEELLTFIQEIDKRDYKLPTEYVFLYVEKRPIEYGQSHYFCGPAWLAGEKYVDFYSFFASRCPQINASEISEEEAMKEMTSQDRPSLHYATPENRTILESKAYLWCQNFSKRYPFEVNVYYEDEDFVCYYFKQNPFALYNLAIEDWDRMDGVQW